MEPQVLFGAAMVATAGPLAWWAVAEERATNKAVAANLKRRVATTATIDARDAALARSGSERAVKPIVAAIAVRAHRLAPASVLAGLERNLVIAGLQGRWPLERLLAVKLMGATVVGLLGVLQVATSPSLKGLVFVLLLTAAAWYVPDVIVRSRARERQAIIRRELPDALDQLTITVEAGLGFETALARTARANKGPLATELLRTVQDVQLGSSRNGALQSLASRLDVSEVRRVVNSLRHADRYGIPVAQVLRIESDDMRERRRQAAEEAAMKMPVKILFPLMFCILPSLFIVILGPVLVRFLD